MIQAGDLKEKIRFEQRGLDANGDRLGAWDTSALPVSAHIRYLTGGEPVMQQRLNGVQPVVITVRASDYARTIRTDWRAYDTRAAVAYDIKGIKPAEQAGFLEVTALSTGANG